MVKGSYLLGCRVSELCRCSGRTSNRWMAQATFTSSAKGSKPRTVRVSTDTLELFESLGRGEPEDWLFPSNKRNGPLTRQAVAARMAMWGREAGRPRSTRTVAGTPMPLMQFGGGWMFSRFGDARPQLDGNHISLRSC